MRRVLLICWNLEEAKQGASRLRAAGYAVESGPPGPESLRRMSEDPPAAVVIDLGRLPSHGRDVAVAIRTRKATRGLPLVFVDGDPVKVARIKGLLPDAAYTSWSRIRASLRAAVARPPAEPVVPASALAGYSGVPLARKLGIKEGSVVALVGAPRGFEGTLGELPAGARLRRRAGPDADLTVWFARSREELQRRIRRMSPPAGKGLWIAWPKKGSPPGGDLTQAAVRETGLASGLVDYKICAIDATWAGLKFTRAKGG